MVVIRKFRCTRNQNYIVIAINRNFLLVFP